MYKESICNKRDISDTDEEPKKTLLPLKNYYCLETILTDQ